MGAVSLISSCFACWAWKVLSFHANRLLDLAKFSRRENGHNWGEDRTGLRGNRWHRGLFRIRKSLSRYGPTTEIPPCRGSVEKPIKEFSPLSRRSSAASNWQVTRNDTQWCRTYLLVLNGQTTSRMPRELEPVALCTASAYVRSRVEYWSDDAPAILFAIVSARGVGGSPADLGMARRTLCGGMDGGAWIGL
jgi:hypothetical protein